MKPVAVDRRDCVVVASLESGDGLRCTDIFRMPDGDYAWDEWRRDPEDPSGWHATGRRSGQVFESQSDAVDAAVNAVDWLKSKRF